MLTVEGLPVWANDDACRVWRELYDSPELLAEVLAADEPEMGLQKRLRTRYPDDVVRTALILRDARKRAAGKFTHAAAMWFDRVNVEQATAEAVARHKAQRFDGRVWDLCCGIGGDALAVATQAEVVAVDLDPATLLRASWNAAIYGVGDRITWSCQDVAAVEPVAGDWLHIDPDRRPGASGRVSRVEDYVPSLEALRAMLPQYRGGAIKLGPASNFGGKFEDVEVELISLNGECKEATLWFGELAGTAPFRATVLPAGITIAGHPLDATAEISGVGPYLYDPDPAVVRAGLVDLVAVQLGLRRLDPAEEYLTGDTLVDSPFVRGFRVLEELPNNERALRQAVRTRAWGTIEIKCRHVPIAADAVQRKLPKEGTQPGVVIFARLNGKTRVVLAERVISSNENAAR